MGVGNRPSRDSRTGQRENWLPALRQPPSCRGGSPYADRLTRPADTSALGCYSLGQGVYATSREYLGNAVADRPIGRNGHALRSAQSSESVLPPISRE